MLLLQKRCQASLFVGWLIVYRIAWETKRARAQAGGKWGMSSTEWHWCERALGWAQSEIAQGAKCLVWKPDRWSEFRSPGATEKPDTLAHVCHPCRLENPEAHGLLAWGKRPQTVKKPSLKQNGGEGRPLTATFTLALNTHSVSGRESQIC